MDSVLEKLFDSPHRAKILRLFLLNAGSAFPVEAISRRTRAKRPTARREISLLEKIGFVKRRRGERAIAYELNELFPLMRPLKDLVLTALPVGDLQIGKILKPTGTLKLLVVSGFFLQTDDGRVDLLVVGDGIERSALDRRVRDIEAEVGKELSYAVLSTDEFLYRLDMCDKFVSDILEKPHRKIINRLDVS